jgi:hypothetical protein
MLRHAHFYMKGGKQTFAAVCLEVRCADKPDLCRRSFRSCSIASRPRHANFDGAANFPRPAVRSCRNKSNPNNLFPPCRNQHTKTCRPIRISPRPMIKKAGHRFSIYLCNLMRVLLVPIGLLWQHLECVLWRRARQSPFKCVCIFIPRVILGHAFSFGEGPDNHADEEHK